MTRDISKNWGLFGHEWAVDMLRQHVSRGTLRHAYLITGPPGLGRRTLALRLAQALNCPQPPAPGEACRSCRTCRQIEAMQFPDLSLTQAETEGGTLKVDQVREVTHTLSLKPYQGQYRVALFLRFQEANPNSANALLKTLEEAPGHAVLVLTADSAEQLLPTIVSRCEVVRLRPLPVNEVEDFLRQRGTQPDQARLVAHLSGGRPGYALRLLSDSDGLEFRHKQLDELLAKLPASRRERFAYAETISKDRETFRRVLLLWAAFWRDVMLTVSGAQAALVNIDRSADIQALAGQLSLPAARRLVADMELGIQRLDKNVNARLLAEVLLLDWPQLPTP